jgi:hypothetical protein
MKPVQIASIVTSIVAILAAVCGLVWATAKDAADSRGNPYPTIGDGDIQITTTEDPKRGVVCYWRKSGNAGGLSCVQLRDGG